MRYFLVKFFVVVLFVSALGMAHAETEASSHGQVNFTRDIRPILSDSCFHCHGPDESTRKAKMRFDTKEGILANRKGRFPVVPGNPDESEIVKRIFSIDPDEQMPPPDHARQLNAKQKDQLKAWIAQGAKWEEHWAFQKPIQPHFPLVKDKKWPRNGIDHFILARLEKEKLKPSGEADKATLLRRVTLDLTGLPPTPSELNAFLKDKSPNAYEKVVDRLLSSPRYGERMAVDWLDLARYSDTHGYQVDRERTMWPWRDWVIKAFNDNKPYDEFTIEQIAGDLLPKPTFEQKIATGFHRNQRINMEGGSIPEEFFVEQVIDRVDTTATVWLGLTLGCARCHDHKYDPLSAKEFYGMYAFFNNINERGVDRENVGRYNLVNTRPFLKLPAPKLEAKVAEFDKKIAAKQKEVDASIANLVPQQDEWEKHVLTNKPDWNDLKFVELKSESGKPTLKSLKDNLIVAEGEAAETDTYFVTAQTEMTNITGMRLEVFPVPGSTNQLGRSADGRFVLFGFSVESIVNGKSTPIQFSKVDGSTERPGFGANLLLKPRANGIGGWSAESKNGGPAVATFEIKEPLSFPKGATLKFQLVQSNPGKTQLGKFRLNVTDDTHPLPLSAALAKTFKTPTEKRKGPDAKKSARILSFLSKRISARRGRIGQVESRAQRNGRRDSAHDGDGGIGKTA